jgi:hypothetical protein
VGEFPTATFIDFQVLKLYNTEEFHEPPKTKKRKQNRNKDLATS